MDIQLHYEEQGQGTPLILLHGNGGDSSYFKRQLEDFSAGYRVIAVDTRGHGQSPRGIAPFRIGQFADDLRSFMDTLGIEKAHLLGFSDGGNIAMVFALRCPERVDRLILNGANLTPGGVKLGVMLPVYAGYAAGRLCRSFSARARAHAEMMDLMIHDPALTPETLHAITARTLVIAGTDDMIREKETRRIAAAIPGAELVIMEGDHFIAGKRPAEFNRYVAEFLSRP